QRRVLKRARSKKQHQGLHRPVGLKGEMREKPMITQRNREPTCAEHHKEHRDLKPIESEAPDVERHRREREEKGADEEGTGNPVDSFEGNALKHEIGRREMAPGGA